LAARVAFSRAMILKLLAYRWTFFVQMAGGLIQALILYFLWRSVFASNPTSTLAGFSFSEMSAYIVMSEITVRLTRSVVDRNMAEDIRSGTLAVNMLFPVDYRAQLLFDALGGVLYRGLITAVPIGIVASALGLLGDGSMAPGWAPIAFAISAFFSFLITFHINFLFGVVAFYTTNTFGLWIAKTAMMSFLAGEMIPLDFFPPAAAAVLRHLPFAGMNYTPVMIWLGKLDGGDLATAIALQAVWVAVLVGIAWVAWRRVVRRISIFGG
jgi:ABC-2 type transport system permease protein